MNSVEREPWGFDSLSLRQKEEMMFKRIARALGYLIVWLFILLEKKYKRLYDEFLDFVYGVYIDINRGENRDVSD